MTISSFGSGSVATAQTDGTWAFVQAAPSSATTKTVTAGTDTGIRTPSPEHVAQAVKQVNEAFVQKGQNLYASIEKDKATGINVVKVTDKDTREVVSQFPSKAIIGMAEAISQSHAKNGQMINVRA